MRIFFSVLSICLMLGLSNQTSAKEPYLQENREAYIASVLEAFYDTEMLAISNTFKYLSVAERNHCKSNDSDLRADCLLSYVTKNCVTMGSPTLVRNCELYSDAIVVNKLAVKTFIGRSERYQMMKNKDVEFRLAMRNRLSQKYGKIVTHFSLTSNSNCRALDFNCLARGLDQFCLGYANTKSLSWQHCIGSATWFIGTAKANSKSE